MKKLLSILSALILTLTFFAVPLSAVNAVNNAVPTKITGLKITTANQRKLLKLTWDQQPNADGYQIYRSATGKSGTYKKIATLRDGSIYVDKGLKAAKTYYYAVRAFRKENGKNNFGPFAKANLSTRLTKDAIQKKLVAANKFFIGWMLHCYEAWEYVDENDQKPVPGEDSDWLSYIRVKSDRYKSVADLKKEAARYFVKSFYEEYIDRMYADIDGKLYIKTYDQGGDGGMGKGKIKVLSLTDTSCKFCVSEYDDYGSDYVYNSDYQMVFKNGKWLFKDMTDSFSIYYQGNSFWL